MDSSSSAIEVRGLSRSFGEVVAVRDLSFSVRPGEIFSLVGPDGAGKTTILRMLAGILVPDKGEITVAGCNVIADPDGVKSRISYMPQRFGLYEDLTSEENMRFYADMYGVSRRDYADQSAFLLDACGMTPFRGRLTANLSGGMKQKLGLICALIHTPQVMLLDEPTNGVDPVSRREFWDILYGLLGRGVTILNSTAYLDEAERCHRLALIHNGSLLFCDKPRLLKERMPGRIVALVCSNGRQLRDRLRPLIGVRDIVLAGDALHIFVDDAALRIPEIRARLEADSVPYSKLEEVTPTIQDVFVDAIKRLVQ
jgi:ABC-2 type transport system ATP-binding protein